MVEVVKEEQQKKKKGRPSLLDLQKGNLREQQQQQQLQQKKKNKGLKDGCNYNSDHNPTSNYTSATATLLRRSTRRNPNPSPERDSDGDELEGNRREKELKLPLKYHKSNSKASDSDEISFKKRKINAIGIGSGSGDYEKERLQKKDTYAVFSEPVDPEELPDYHEVIEHPMDFGTVRNKLTDGAYASLEQFEKDIFVICSNAMQYNAPHTIYFRQARLIHKLAKKNFDNLRQDSDNNKPEAKVVGRGRPPTKNFKKPLDRPPLERAHSDLSSDATLASGAENNVLANHDLGKAHIIWKSLALHIHLDVFMVLAMM